MSKNQNPIIEISQHPHHAHHNITNNHHRKQTTEPNVTQLQFYVYSYIKLKQAFIITRSHYLLHGYIMLSGPDAGLGLGIVGEDNIDGSSCVVIEEVMPGSPADKSHMIG